MTLGGRRGRGKSFYTSGGLAAKKPWDEEGEYKPVVDKNPYYRTMDILNGVFRKNIKLSEGKMNATDGKTIWVNFGERRMRPIVDMVGPGKAPTKSVYLLKCGHEWEGNAGHATDGSKYGACAVCGAEQSYLGFEHEWQHIIFKSDLAARALFVSQYSVQLAQQYPGVNIIELQQFLAILVNAFEDLRCNSLWEKVYPGSAQQIWERWQRLTKKRGNEVNEDFISFIFAVAFNIPTDPNGEFEPLRPIVEWGVQKVKYRGFMNMLVDLRVVLDRCMGALLANVPPPPPKQPQPPQPQPGPPDPSQQGAPQQQQQNSGAGDQSSPPSDPQEGQQDAAQNPQAASNPQQGAPDHDGEEAGGQGDSDGKGQGDIPVPSHIPSAQQVQASPKEQADALKKLMKDAKPLDEGEEHKEPTQEQIDEAQKSQALRAMLAQAMGMDISDIGKVDSMMPDDEPDQDMAQAIQQLQDGLAQKSQDSQLTSNAKAKILLIDVTPEGVANDPKIELTDEERFAVARMRAAFFRTLGRQKAKRSSEGTIIDVPSLIQYRLDHQDPDVFESEAVQQGFTYSILCDMSGSMHGTFPLVCHAVEMLKQALNFPFVVGNLWGFRGGTGTKGRQGDWAEVWMYRYSRKCRGYTGKARARGDNGQMVTVPVECDGSTPMNAAINVAVTHLWRKMPAGMAKRLFILTDGSPAHLKVTGKLLPDWLLRKFVAKEINLARQHGIQVYTLVIGDHAISEDQCKEMFGPPRFWKKVGTSGENSVDRVLTRLVLDNFTKYIKARG